MQEFSNTGLLQQEFYVSDGIYQFGPFNKFELFDLISESQVSVTDYVYDSQKKQWKKVASFVEDFNSKYKHSKSGNSSLLVGLEPETQSTSDDFLEKLENSNHKINQFSSMVQNSVQRWWIKEKLFILGPYHFLSLLSLWNQGGIEPKHLILSDKNDVGTEASAFFKDTNIEKYKKLKPQRLSSGQLLNQSRRQYPRVISEQLIFIYSDVDCKIVQLYDLSRVSLSFVSVDDYFFRGDELVCTLVDSNQKQHQFDARLLSVSQIDAIDGKIALKKYVLQFDEEISENIFQLFTNAD